MSDGAAVDSIRTGDSRFGPGVASLPPDMIYRVVTDLEALRDGFADRIEDLGLVKSDAPWSREFCWKTLGDALKGTGLALAFVLDDERFAPIRSQMVRRKSNLPPIAGSKRPAWLFTRKKACEMGKRRFSLMTDSQKKKHQRLAGIASGKARRAKRKSAQRLAATS